MLWLRGFKLYSRWVPLTLEPALYVHVRKVCTLLGVKERQRPTLGVRCSEV